MNISKSVTLKESQQLVDEWINTIGVHYFSELANLTQLMEEIGEVVRVISLPYGDQTFKPSIQYKKLMEES